eukprot:CAMPEP_0203846264 /NCGR_PEP_ID=MMETSP0359-20131031/4315_1 /ASSEMBLY_ACC=CAM_ASM_000338 /TAXON_ID=268821 /ORGANISM="Scrippsiella Hangoei, Strain SHTV-5" /LENGTH=111 /DNA_ID=CAMNT_0050761547 /DNA_START=450 /DNA_END=781 /DNA_ORIENTATION=-
MSRGSCTPTTARKRLLHGQKKQNVVQRGELVIGTTFGALHTRVAHDPEREDACDAHVDNHPTALGEAILGTPICASNSSTVGSSGAACWPPASAISQARRPACTAACALPP